MFAKYCLSVLFLLLFAVPAGAGFLTDGLRQRYAAINAMQADFTQILLHKESGSREKRSGSLTFKKPLLVRWEITAPAPELLLVGKEAIWNAFPEEEIVYKYDPGLAQDSRSIIRVVTGQAHLEQDFFVEEEGAENGLVRLRLYPKEPTQSLVEAMLWVDPNESLIKKVRIYDFYGNENEITFTRLNTSASVNDAVFTYTPPKGFLVEDMTEDSGAQPKKPLMR